jgi:hypothetical protein
MHPFHTHPLGIAGNGTQTGNFNREWLGLPTEVGNIAMHGHTVGGWVGGGACRKTLDSPGS